MTTLSRALGLVALTALLTIGITAWATRNPVNRYQLIRGTDPYIHRMVYRIDTVTGAVDIFLIGSADELGRLADVGLDEFQARQVGTLPGPGSSRGRRE